MKKVICILLFLTLAMGTVGISSCGEAKDTASTTSAPTEETVLTTEPTLTDGLPEKDFGGIEFTFCTPGEVHWGALAAMDVEGETGEVLNDAIYTRNSRVEDRFNVDIKDEKIPYSSIAQTVKKSIMAGDGSYDAAYMWADQMFPLAMEGLFAEFDDIPFVDLSKPWWDQNADEAFSVEGNLFYMVGDANMFYNDTTWVLMFNKTLIKQYNLENPYELVKNDKWTYKKFFEMGKAVISDVDGDGEMTVADQYGFLTHTESVNSLIYASGEPVFTKNEQDVPQLAVSERLYGVLEEVRHIFNDDNVTFDVINPKNKNAGFDAMQPLFEANRALFAGEVLECVRRYRTMETDFGLLPWPKYDQTQKDYCHYTLSNVTPVAVPSNLDAEKLEMTGIILEALHSASHDTLLPAYYTSALEGKYLRDDESRDMLDLILRTRIYPFGSCKDLGGLIAAVRNSISANKSDFVSVIEKQSAKAEGDIEKIVSSVEGLQK
ncbi:MAG: extracellular solute-binding protein [Eubacteriales bacterium]